MIKQKTKNTTDKTRTISTKGCFIIGPVENTIMSEVSFSDSCRIIWTSFCKVNMNFTSLCLSFSDMNFTFFSLFIPCYYRPSWESQLVGLVLSPQKWNREWPNYCHRFWQWFNHSQKQNKHYHQKLNRMVVVPPKKIK